MRLPFSATQWLRALFSHRVLDQNLAAPKGQHVTTARPHLRPIRCPGPGKYPLTHPPIAHNKVFTHRLKVGIRIAFPQTGKASADLFPALPLRPLDLGADRGHKHTAVGHMLHQFIEVLIVPGLGKIRQKFGGHFVVVSHTLVLRRGSGPLVRADNITAFFMKDMEDSMIIGHELYGGGPDGVIVMHDFYGCRDTWAFARNFFDTRHFTFAFVEVRGYGASRHIPGEYTPVEAASDILALADNLGWQQFHIVGHSMSGMLAQRVVLDGGERVKSAILNTPVAATGLAFSPEGLAVITDSITDNDALAQAFDVLTGNRLCREWLDFKIRQTRSTRSTEAQAGYLKSLASQGFLDRMKGNTTPMLIIIGEFDMEPFTAAITRETFLTWYPNAEMAVCRNAGHYPQQEAPVYVATVINRFLQKQL